MSALHSKQKGRTATEMYVCVFNVRILYALDDRQHVLGMNVIR